MKMRHRVGRKYKVLKTLVNAITVGQWEHQTHRLAGAWDTKHGARNKRKKETEFRLVFSRDWVLGEWEATTQQVKNFI